MNKRSVLSIKSEQLQKQTQSYLTEIKKLVHDLQTNTKINLISYFTYSLNISHNTGQESLCLGSYHIHNIGNKTITNPYILIKTPVDSIFSFSGRYVYEHFNQSLKGEGAWERINEKTNKEEFLLKPMSHTTIQPNEVITFSNFQIKWSPIGSYAGSIMGFTYGDQLKDGVAVVNPININGTVLVEDGYE